MVTALVRGYDAAGEGLSVDVVPTLCQRVAPTGQIEQAVEPFSAHFIDLELENRYSGYSGSGVPQTPAVESTPGNIGTEIVREYLLTYQSLEDGPELGDERVVTTLVIPPDSTMVATGLYLAGFRTKEQYRFNGDLTRGPRRYQVHYTFVGDEALRFGYSLSTDLGDFNNCGALGEGWRPAGSASVGGGAGGTGGAGGSGGAGG